MTKVSDSSVVELGFNSEVRQALKAFKEAKEAEASAKARKSEAEKVLRDALGGATQATIGGVVAYKLVNGSNSHADLKELAKAFPEAYEATLRVSKYDFVKAV